MHKTTRGAAQAHQAQAQVQHQDKGHQAAVHRNQSRAQISTVQVNQVNQELLVPQDQVVQDLELQAQDHHQVLQWDQDHLDQALQDQVLLVALDQISQVLPELEAQAQHQVV